MLMKMLTMMNLTALMLEFTSGLMGFVGAYFWFLSARVPINPLGSFEPVEEADKANFWNAGLIEAFQKSSYLNKRAALYTAISATFASMGGMMGAFGFIVSTASTSTPH